MRISLATVESELASGADATIAAELRGAVKQVSVNTVGLMLGQALARAVSLTYVLVITRFLPVEAFGFYSLLLSLFVVADTAADFGLGRLMIRDLARDAGRISDYVGVIFPIKLLFGGIAYGALLCFLWIAGYPRTLIDLAAIGGLALLPSGTVLLLHNLLHSQQRFIYVSTVHLCYTAAQCAAGTVLLVLGGGVGALLASAVICYVGYAAVLLRGCWKRGFRFRPRLDARLARRLLSDALPYAGIALLSILSGRIEPLVLGRFGDGEALGLFGAASKITDAATFFPMMLSLALTPIVARYHVQSAQKLAALYFWSARAVLFFMVPAAAFVVAAAPWIVSLLFPAAFAPSTLLLQIVFAAQPLAALWLMNATILFPSDRLDRILLVLTGAAVAQLIVDLALIPPLGAPGAAMAVAASQLVMATALSVVVQRWFLPPGMVMRALAAPAGAATAMAACWLLLAPALKLAAAAPAIAVFIAVFALLHRAVPQARPGRYPQSPG